MRLLLSLVVVLAGMLGLGIAWSKSEAYSAPTQGGTKQVRFTNQTDIAIRIRCIGYEQDHNFTRDLARGAQEMVTGVDPGLRVVVVYEHGGWEIVAKKGFKLEAQGRDAEIIVQGDKADGYQVKVRYLGF
jgi:hypothetical protein